MGSDGIRWEDGFNGSQRVERKSEGDPKKFRFRGRSWKLGTSAGQIVKDLFGIVAYFTRIIYEFVSFRFG